jgi:alanyl-tRNA synthetase
LFIIGISLLINYGIMVTSKEIRKKFLEYFKAQDHAIIPSAPVVPENDPTVLFNTAGMQPLVPYLLGEKHPLGTRLADSQKCIRTVDIEEVGDNSHLTYFEML